jgi:site-specific recombinase XerC
MKFQLITYRFATHTAGSADVRVVRESLGHSSL